MIEVNNKTRTKINTNLIKRTTEEFLKYYKINKDISIALVGDTVIRRLNKEYRKIDRVTDVLAFEGEDNYLGELIIDHTQIRRQAKRFSPSTEKELVFILTHGLLHLLGYEDKTEEGKMEMERLGKEFIDKLGK